ncbi:MAG: phytanoyl-CoA dioxygenase family protein [bacterium]|nr:phytanoyl-CoA dioxygenase family protein [bacterium]
MLEIEIVEAEEVEKAEAIFRQDGFVVVRDALSPEQLAFAQEGAARVIQEQTTAVSLEKANRGFARYSFGPQLHHPEWTQLIDLPTVLPILERIWKSRDFFCWGGGGDYSLPGAKIQHLHADISDVIGDPEGRVTIMDLPTPVIVVNFPMVDFTVENGATRFVRGTQRSRHPVPKLEEEPEWMKGSVVCGPAGAALIRDIRCWHGGTANRSNEIRPMTSVGYAAPWFLRFQKANLLPRSVYDTLPDRAKELTRLNVEL